MPCRPWPPTLKRRSAPPHALHAAAGPCSTAGFDPLGLAADPEKLKWNAESERVHARWAMLGVAGILAQVCAAAPAPHTFILTPRPAGQSGEGAARGCSPCHGCCLLSLIPEHAHSYGGCRPRGWLCAAVGDAVPAAPRCAPQEIVHPEQFWYTSGAEVELPFNIFGLVAFELFAMHFVEVRAGDSHKIPRAYPPGV